MTEQQKQEMRLTLWRHKARGTIYRILGFGHIEKDWVPSVTYESVAEEGLITRPIVEFTDGRFEPYNGMKEIFGALQDSEDDSVDCGCRACNPNANWFIVCSICGNKRCPHATDHQNNCTGSNEPGQEGSVFA